MKKYLLIFAVVLLAATGILLAACTEKTIDDDCLSYEMNLSLADNTLSGEQTVRYRNIYVEGLGQSVFHLYPNAYAQDAVNPAYTSELASYGGIEVSSVTVNGEKAEFSLSEDKEYLTVTHAALGMGEEIEFGFTFVTTVPKGMLRLSECDGAYTLSGFYPQLSVYDGECFRTDKFSAIGDPIYSSVADYSVTFECDKSLVVCSSVKNGETVTEGERQKIKMEGEDIRDFAIICNADYNVLSAKAGEITVYYFYESDENAQQTLDTAVSAIETFGNAFGAYPYETYTVARAPFMCDGMEYSGISLIAEVCTDVCDAVLHETAHQWWYGAVGSDCINESYMDEGLATFSAAYYYSLKGDDAKFNEEIGAIKRAYSSYEKLQNHRKTGMNLAMDKPIYEYTEYQYTMVEYFKGCMMFENFYELYGKEKFEACLKKYYEDNKFRIGGKKAFLAAAEKTMGDIKGLMDGWTGEKIVATTFAEAE